MLTRNNVGHYLVGRGLLHPGSIVDGDVKVVDASRRNHNVSVIAADGPSYFVKQSEAGAASLGSLAYEASVYEAMAGFGGKAPSFQRLLPTCRGYDPASGILVLDLLPDAENVRHHHVRLSRMPVGIAEQIGQALGLLHSTNLQQDRSDRWSFLSREPPTVFALALPTLDLYHGASAGNVELIRLIQSAPQLCDRLHALQAEWRQERLIHGDPRWDNWLVPQRSRARQRRELKLVDWEFACLGDPSWDIGSLLAEYLGAWVLTIPVFPGVPLDRALPYTCCPLSRIQPAMRAMWQAYARRRGLGFDGDELARALGFAAVKLIHLASERMHQAREVSATAAACVQLAANILREPDRAAGELLGLARDRERSA